MCKPVGLSNVNMLTLSICIVAAVDVEYGHYQRFCFKDNVTKDGVDNTCLTLIHN